MLQLPAPSYGLLHHPKAGGLLLRQGGQAWCCLMCSWASPCPLLSYGMRYVAKILRTSLAEKFPNASEEEIDKVPCG